MYLENYLQGYCRNLGFVRFAAALMVIYAHSFPLSVGYAELDLFMRVSGCTMSFGSFAVHIFFISSGLLVARSLEKDGNLRRFGEKRLIRILPPLWLTVLLTFAVLGPLFTSLPARDYFLNRQSWGYLGSLLLLPEQGVPGLFETNIYPGAVNGSLWTLRIEIVCYLFLMICHALGLMREKYLGWMYPLFLAGLALCLFTEYPLFLLLKKYYVLLFSFYNGMVLWVYRRRIRVSYLAAALMLGLFAGAVWLGYPDLGACLFFAYAFVVFVFAAPQCPDGLGRLGDMSYGIYLCAFPIQQCVTACFGGAMRQEANFLIAAAVSIPAGWLISRIGEKKAGGWLLARIK